MKVALIADADLLTEWALAKALGGQYAVHVARSAEAALQEMERCGVDVLILGDNLPGDDDDEVAERCRRDFPEALVIRLISHVADPPRAAGPGMYRLDKPFALEKLMRLLREPRTANGSP